MNPTTAQPVLLPRAPVLDWSSFKRTGELSAACIQDAPNVAFTSSGRAALFQALRQLNLPAGRSVLVPTYHCPTMVAPVVCAGLKPVFFGLQEDGLPDLNTLDTPTARHAGAIIVAHYFGLPRSLSAVREWCDLHHVALIEDCAHAFFGMAGDRPVGHWGDFASASVSKFFPVPEGGLLVSASRPIKALALDTPGLRAQIKGWVDVLEFAVDHGRIWGMNSLLRPILDLKNHRARAVPAQDAVPASGEASMLRTCNMHRINQAPLAVSLLLNRALPRGRIAARRRANFALYSDQFSGVAGARPLFAATADVAAPYVFPLWVNDADRIYRWLHRRRFPVFRWDRIWPGTPDLSGDAGARWSRNVLQLLCHQDLSEEDIRNVATAILRLLNNPGAPTDD